MSLTEYYLLLFGLLLLAIPAVLFIIEKFSKIEKLFKTK